MQFWLKHWWIESERQLPSFVLAALHIWSLQGHFLSRVTIPGAVIRREVELEGLCATERDHLYIYIYIYMTNNGVDMLISAA
jgi:hypothetical protein